MKASVMMIPRTLTPRVRRAPTGEVTRFFQEGLHAPHSVPFQTLAQNGTFADLHVGVVTSDYGAGATGAPGCSPSPGGQQGRMQARGAKAATNCKTPVGANYVSYKFAANGAPGQNNLPIG